MGILSAIKETFFAETADKGKVCQVKWLSDEEGVATVLVPIKAYDRFPKRAALRAVQVKVPNATKVQETKQERGSFHAKSDEGFRYYLIRATFRVSK
jgi:hypothetical protein